MLLLRRDCFTCCVCVFKLLPLFEHENDDPMTVFKLTNLRIKKQKKKKRNTPAAEVCRVHFSAVTFFFFFFFKSQSQVRLRQKHLRYVPLSSRTFAEESSWGQSRRAPLVAASTRQLNVMDFPARDVTTGVSHRHRTRCQQSLSAMDGFFFFSLPCNSQHMHRPYYQQGLGLQGHMVTDWVDWLQVSISLMPVGLSLQMSLFLLTPRKKKIISARPLSAFFLCFFLSHLRFLFPKFSLPFIHNLNFEIIF